MSKNAVITIENARFTVVAGNCIRLEYSMEGKFIDLPSWVAINREGASAGYELKRRDGAVEIHTESLVLVYRPDGAPFHADNLSCRIACGEGRYVTWRFGERNRFNLGGNVATLDSVTDEIPLSEGLLSRDGWFLLEDSDSCLLRDGWLEPRPENHGYDGYFFGYGVDYRAALRSFVQLAGRVPLPRKYTLGVWYSRWFAYTAEDYRTIVREFEQHDFPLDIVVMDMDWHTKPKEAPGFGWDNTKGWSGWSWNRNLIPDPQELLDWYHQRGLHVTLNVHPHDGIRPHEDAYPAFMRQLGHDPDRREYVPFRAGDRSYMQAYFEQVHRPLEAQGVDFWWVDWQQDSLIPRALGLENMTHLPMLNFAYFQHSQTGGKRGQSLSRWAGWGDHRHPIHFSGDALSEWRTLAFEIFVTLTAGNVGCFYWSHDMGGFAGRRNPELYVRWLQFGLTTAAMRLHSLGDDMDRRPWLWGAENERRMREITHLRARLIPVVYSLMYQGYAEALPLLRPLYLSYPEQEEAYRQRYEYMLGDLFVVAPVTVPVDADGQAATEVWFPEGEWVNWFTGERFRGPAPVTVKSSLEDFPLFVRSAAPVVLAPYSDRMTRNIPETLDVVVQDGIGSGCFSLYEDDGISDAYMAGERALTPVEYRRSETLARLEIGATEGGYAGQPVRRAWQIELHGMSTAPVEVCLDGVAVAWKWDDGVCLVKIGTDSIRKSRVLEWRFRE